LPSGYKFAEHYECRCTSLIGAANLSPVTKLVAGTGPEVSGVQIVSEPEISHDAGFKLRADARVRVPGYVPVLVSGSESCKKHDKRLTFIVRVMLRILLMR